MNRLLTFLLLIVPIFMVAKPIPYRKSNLWGYSDSNGKIIFTPQYEKTEFFEGNVAFIMKDSFYYLIDTNFQIIASKFLYHGNFINNVCPVKLPNGMFVYINEYGVVQFEKIFKAAENFSEERAVVQLGNKLGIIDTKGNWIYPLELDTTSVYFNNQHILAIKNGKYFHINSSGKILKLPDNYLPIASFNEGLAPIYVKTKEVVNGKMEDQYLLKFIDTSGNVILDSFYNQGMYYSPYLNYAANFKDGKAIVSTFNSLSYDYYFLNKDKKFSPSFNSARCIGDSLYIGVIGFEVPSISIYNYRYMNLGTFKRAETPTDFGVITEGLIPVKNKNNLWGFADKNAKLIIPYQYQFVNNFKDGYALVVKDNKEGYINHRGVAFFED